MISISHYLYRKSGKWATAALLAILLPSSLVTAQIRDRTEHQRVDQGQATHDKEKKKNQRGPRAIAVVEFLPGGGTRLVPIALWIDGHFYDASLYGANPEPMALQPETLYQALAYGQPTGWFTVTTPEDVDGNWVAGGQWKAETPVEARLAQQAAKEAKSKPKGHDTLGGDEDRPVLRRLGNNDKSPPNPSQGSSTSGGNQSSGSGGSTSGNPPKKDDPPDRPTLKASPSAASPAPSSSKPTLGDNTQQADAQAPAPKAPPSESPDEDDPNRPVLRRGKPPVRPSAADTDGSNASMNKTAEPVAGGGTISTPSTSPKVGQAPRGYAAISDAGNYETRSLLYGMATGERQRLGEPMSKMAMDELRKYAAQHNGPAMAKTAAITDYDLRGFDLDYSNSPTLVLSAALPVAPAKPTAGAGFNYFVTVVARVDVSGVPQKIFSVVTDTNHLDAYPRMQIIDAIDADANGRGDLLFRQYSDTGISYALYRVFPYQMQKIFEGGSSM